MRSVAVRANWSAKSCSFRLGRDHDLLAMLDSVEQFGEFGLGFAVADAVHDSVVQSNIDWLK